MMMYECDKCKDYATVEVAGYPYARYLCSLHASRLAESLGATLEKCERISRESARVEA